VTVSESEEEESKVAKPLKKQPKKEQPLNLPNKPQAKSKAPLGSKKNKKPSKMLGYKDLEAYSDSSNDE